VLGVGGFAPPRQTTFSADLRVTPPARQLQPMPSHSSHSS
jgi:hypothetical protein